MNILKESFSQVAKKYLIINNKAKSVTPAENKAFQASEQPQGHTSFEEQIQSGTQDYMSPVGQW